MLPTYEELITQCQTEKGRQNLIADFRTDRSNLTIQEVLTQRLEFDEDIAEFVDQVDAARNSTEDWALEDCLYELRKDIIAAYGFDGFDDGIWVNSNY